MYRNRLSPSSAINKCRNEQVEKTDDHLHEMLETVLIQFVLLIGFWKKECKQIIQFELIQFELIKYELIKY